MTQFPAATSSEQTLYAALELSTNSWLLAIYEDPLSQDLTRRDRSAFNASIHLYVLRHEAALPNQERTAPPPME